MAFLVLVHSVIPGINPYGLYILIFNRLLHLLFWYFRLLPRYPWGIFIVRSFFVWSYHVFVLMLYLPYKINFQDFPSLLCSGTTWVLMNLSSSQLWYLCSPLFFPTLLRSGEALLQIFLFSDRSVLYLVLIFKHFSLFPCLQFFPMKIAALVVVIIFSWWIVLSVL